MHRGSEQTQPQSWCLLTVQVERAHSSSCCCWVLLSEVPDAVVRTKGTHTWVYLTERVKCKVLGCRLLKAVAGNPAGVDGGGSSNVLEVRG